MSAENPTPPEAELFKIPDAKAELKRIAQEQTAEKIVSVATTATTIEQVATKPKVERMERYPKRITLGGRETKLQITESAGQYRVETEQPGGTTRDFGHVTWQGVEVSNGNYIVGTTSDNKQSLIGREGKPLPTNRNNAIFEASAINLVNDRIVLNFSDDVWQRIQTDEFASQYYGSGLDERTKSFSIKLDTYQKNVGTR